MKSFYEMMMILEGLKNGGSGYREWGSYDGPPDYYDEEEINYSNLVIGEDQDDFCSAEVSGTDSAWSLVSGVFVRGYVPTGKENPISKPKYQEPDQHNRGGTDFENPGKNFENMPPDLARKCIDFIDAEVKRYIGNYTPDDPRDYDEPRGREWDDQDQDRYDRQVWLGGEDY